MPQPRQYQVEDLKNLVRTAQGAPHVVDKLDVPVNDFGVPCNFEDSLLLRREDPPAQQYAGACRGFTGLSHCPRLVQRPNVCTDPTSLELQWSRRADMLMPTAQDFQAVNDRLAAQAADRDEEELAAAWARMSLEQQQYPSQQNYAPPAAGYYASQNYGGSRNPVAFPPSHWPTRSF
ncbi:hypothetical protein BDZ89DRAFT_1152968 [Hymenopellis radicata]|nr:hypothetical protein BDZ89DRAFT_1152968 [Hymenopellis radicata]